MKIVFLIPSMRGGGAERVFANLLSLWDLTRDEVHLVLLTREGPLLELIPDAVIVHELGTPRFWQAIPRLLKLVRSLAADALLSTQAHMNAVAGLLRPWWRVAKVVGRETNMPLQVGRAKKSSFVRAALYRWGYRGLDTVVCLSRAMADEVAGLYGVGAAVTVIPNPLRLNELRDDAVIEPGLAMESGRWLSAAGRLSEQKGFDLLLEALPLLPPDVRVCILGDGPLRQPLERQAERLGVRDRVVFAGFQAHPNRFVSRSRLFVLSSRYEGLPNAALEALALGVPVVAFDGPWGAGEVVIEGVTGLLAKPLDPRDLAETIARALSATWDQQQIQSWVDERFNGKSIVSRYREVLS